MYRWNVQFDRFRYYTRWHAFANRKRYDAPADPWTLVHVDPSNVEYCNNEIRLNWGLGRVQGGRWNREEHRYPVREMPIWRGLVQRFEDGDDWDETTLYRRAADRFDDGVAHRGYEDVNEFRDVRCEYLDTLYETIRDDGYRSNRDAGHDNPAASDVPFEDAYAHHLEPLVVIGPSGEIYWTEGYHRLAIASILNVDEIPVHVLCRHEEWQRIRDEIHGIPGSDRSPEFDGDTAHPDLRDIGA